MNIRYISQLFSLIVFLGSAFPALANPHQCPTLRDIKNTISDQKALCVQDHYLGGKLSSLTYFNNFNTNETWYLYYRSIDSYAKNDLTAWKNFQHRLDTTPNPPTYAKDNFFSWDCVYVYEETQTYLIARLMSP